MINIKNVTFSYEQKMVFEDLNLTIEQGEFVAILGHNGSGKSTLSKLLLGLEIANEGEIWINGVRLSDETIHDIRRKMSIVFQNPDNQFVGATVADDIAFGLENRQVPREEMAVLVDKYIDYLGLSGLENAVPHQLSGGQKQRTAIAGVLAVGADILILDEATSMLDPASRTDVMKLIQELARDEKRTIVMITHHLDEAMYADRLVILNEGKIVLKGTPHDVFEHDEILESVGLDIPFAVKASRALYQQSVINKICMTNEALVEALRCT